MDWADYLRGETAKYRQLAETAKAHHSIRRIFGSRMRV
jgi:hypothetical protein